MRVMLWDEENSESEVRWIDGGGGAMEEPWRLRTCSALYLTGFDEGEVRELGSVEVARNEEGKSH